MNFISAVVPALLTLTLSPGPTVSPKPVAKSQISYNSVYLFSEQTHGVLLEREQAMLDADMPGMAERDILVTVITRDSDPPLYAQNVDAGAGFTLVLYGKTGEKLYKSKQLVERTVLYKVLDRKNIRKDSVHNDRKR
jgi:hypothetical protein